MTSDGARKGALDRVLDVNGPHLSVDRRREADTVSGHLEADLRDELTSLGMPGVEFRVHLRQLEPERSDDRCEFLIRLNPGLPEVEVAETASGGEAARLLLALHSLRGAGERETWVFDEIDAGTSGDTALAVARHLARLATGSQVIAITHQPSVASAAHGHLRILKTSTPEDSTTVTTVHLLDDESALDETVRLLGGREGDPNVRGHVMRLRELSSTHARRRPS